MEREAWWATFHGVAESNMTEATKQQLLSIVYRCHFV